MTKLPTVEGIPIPGFMGSPGPHFAEEAYLRPGQRPEKAGDKTGPAPPSRFRLRMEAGLWRGLQYAGTYLHFAAKPSPPSPDFTRTVTSTIASERGEFQLQFYTPKAYGEADTAGTGATTRYPAVVNFHGGGFTLGQGTDDARFARFVLERCDAVFISVDYRLAPESPFPTAVEDGADALLYVIRNADELRIDPRRVATSGFSAGGNLAVTAPLRLHAYLTSGGPRERDHRIVAVAAWYPTTDFTLTRAERRTGSRRPDQNIPPILTDLFDQAYLYPPSLDLADPWLSPGKAPDELLVGGLPDDIIVYTCEWDMLLREGEDFAARLAAEPINKNVQYTMVDSVPHGWDKGPSVFSPPGGSEEVYAECCERLRRVFESAD